MKRFGPTILLFFALGCEETPADGTGALATATTELDAGPPTGTCQEVCDYDGCTTLCAEPPPPVVPIEDPYDDIAD